MHKENLNSLIQIERQKLKEFQSNMDKLISSINKHSNNIKENNLIDILFLNQDIETILNKIKNVEMNIISNIKHTNIKNKDQLETYNRNNKIIAKYLPYMLLESMTSN